MSLPPHAPLKVTPKLLLSLPDYSYMSEHSDLRHIMGVGIAMTRGCAAALSFDYCVLLLTMSRNLLTKLKESSLHQYIPIDSHLQFHKVNLRTMHDPWP